MVSGVFGLIQTAIAFGSMIVPAHRAQPAPRARRPRRADARVHRRHALRLARLQLRPLGVAAPPPDGLPDDARDDRHVRQGGQAVRPRAVLHRPVPASCRGSTRTASAGSSSPATSWASCGASITTLAGSLTYLYVALQAIAGRLTLGDLTLFTQAASSVQGSVQGLLGGFGSMYENNLYLNDLFELLATPSRDRASTSRATRPAEAPRRPAPTASPRRDRVRARDVPLPGLGRGGAPRRVSLADRARARRSPSSAATGRGSRR